MKSVKSISLKALSVLCLVFGILGAVVYYTLAVVRALSAISPVSVGMMGASAVIGLIGSAIMILGGAVGFGASQNPGKAKRSVVLGIIMIIMSLLGIVIGFFSTSPIQAVLDSVTAALGRDSIALGGLRWVNFVNIADLIVSALYCLSAYFFSRKTNRTPEQEGQA